MTFLFGKQRIKRDIYYESFGIKKNLKIIFLFY
ncbi:Hypothetical Protein SLY_0893 [Strawberry lethal yellows phytoplasma (CPA) str. NZSb11]|uniref:Uncharacterized protein n=1 Tax=Strawberry lethal yellows phytoplasma (CPA) str. NZSb11 TaxID=980422 RepID=R4S1X7_PHYAS|nr:Hypothetical Protein SLY_0893 [Strawberry lethal yellows phytoplasma (CPA) str. NZSb11]